MTSSHPSPFTAFCFALLLLVGAKILQAQGNPPALPAPARKVLQIPEPGRFKNLFQPFRTDNAALSPDGKYLAYSLREGEKVFLRVIEVDHPEKIVSQG